MSEQVEVAAHIQVETVRRHGVTVIRVEGEIDMLTCDEVRGEVIEGLTEPTEVLVLDLTGVTFFGSVGLSMLIEARHRAELRDIRFAVAADQRAVLGPMTETGIDGLVVLRADVTEAAAAARARSAA
ncbi:STAS domain-containing protein [Saccharothrix hoggarensis]|uniref:Anti-sigma factor antagonist n=1 Tax=Saccharothrix hoggarensis TaxID=913853 RepID=A0ABW3QQZ9_9PSEU